MDKERRDLMEKRKERAKMASFNLDAFNRKVTLTKQQKEDERRKRLSVSRGAPIRGRAHTQLKPGTFASNAVMSPLKLEAKGTSLHDQAG